MDIYFTEKGKRIYRNVLEALTFKTSSGDTLTIVMKDNGFDITYDGKEYRFDKKSKLVEPMTAQEMIANWERNQAKEIAEMYNKTNSIKEHDTTEDYSLKTIKFLLDELNRKHK